MRSLTITFSNHTKKILKEKLLLSQNRGDLRLYKRIAALFGITNGYTVAELAEILGVSAKTIWGWFSQFLTSGLKSLVLKEPPGRPARLTKSQKLELSALIEAGPPAAGYPGACWRSPMIQHVIRSRFGIIYSTAYIAQLLKNMGFSFQKAKFEASHKDEEARALWLETTWPTILKKAKELGAYIFFGDEASFPQWGSLSYTWARKGITPIIKTSGKRKGYKVFGAIEYSTGQFFSQCQDGKLNEHSYTHFIESILDASDRPVILIQDGAPYHTSQLTNEFFLDNSDRLTVYQLPSYSPDFNPIESLWKKIKQTGTHLHYFPTFESLTEKVDLMIAIIEQEAEEVLKLFGFYKKDTSAA